MGQKRLVAVFKCSCRTHFTPKYESTDWLPSNDLTALHKSPKWTDTFRVHSPAILSLVAAGDIAAYKGQGLLGRSALNCTLGLRDMACSSTRGKGVGGLWQWKYPPHSTRKAQRRCAIRGTASPPQPYKYTCTARAKKAPLVWSCCKTSRRWADQNLPWRAGGQPKTWANNIKADVEPISGPRILGHAPWRKDWVKVSSELEQDRRVWSARHGQRNWWCRLNQLRVYADASTSK